MNAFFMNFIDSFLVMILYMYSHLADILYHILSAIFDNAQENSPSSNFVMSFEYSSVAVGSIRGSSVGSLLPPPPPWRRWLTCRHAFSPQEVVVVRLQPATDEEKLHYASLYSYLSKKNRLGVVGGFSKAIKDFYILPLASTEPVPSVLLPFAGPGQWRWHILRSKEG